MRAGQGKRSPLMIKSAGNSGAGLRGRSHEQRERGERANEDCPHRALDKIHTPQLSTARLKRMHN